MLVGDHVQRAGLQAVAIGDQGLVTLLPPSARVLLVAQANEDKIAVVGVGKARHAQHGVAVEMADAVNDLDPFILHVVVVAGFVLDVPVEGQVELWSAGCERRRDGERFTVL